MKRLIVFISTILLCLQLFAQSSDNQYTSAKERVRELFENEAYTATDQVVEKVLLQYPDIDDFEKSQLTAYGLMSRIKMKYPDIDGAVIKFEDRFPFSTDLARIKFFQSNYYFDKGDYSRALSILNDLENNYLPRDEKLEYIYNKAFCNLRVGEYNLAAVGFEKVISLGSNPFIAPCTYYLGYVHYLNKEFDKAIPLFDKMADDSRFSLLSRLFSIESRFMLKNYDYVIEHGDELFEKLQGDYKLKLARIISESYFAVDNVKEAKKYFEIYSSSNAVLSRKDNYYSGVVSYSLKSYYLAIEAFEKVADKSDSLGQNAYLYLGNSYLGIKNKHNALQAFKAASECDFDRTIKEESSFQYAKLAFDVNSDISVFNNYLSSYPSSSKSDEIHNYIATAYLLKKDYKSAVVSLEKIKKPTPQMTINLQKAAFFRAMQLLERGAYRSSIEDFKTSIKNGYYNQPLSLLARFWMAEAYYRTDNFTEAVNINTSLVRDLQFRKSGEYPLALFNLGYAYFKKADFDNAIFTFNQFLDTAPSKRTIVVESRTRIADCYFMKKDYPAAAKLFEEIANLNYDANDIYAAYQGAISYGLISDDEKKIEMLKNAVDEKPSSKLYTKAVYEIGRAYIQVGDNENAVKYFSKLLSNQRDSIYYSKALLELGMINSNLGKYGEALECFNTIVESMPLSEDANNALAGIESIYQIQNKTDEFLEYLERVGMSSVKSAGEKELMLFNSAEQIFLSGNYSEARNALQTYIKRYPEGAKTAQAYFYLAEALSKLGKMEAAADAYLTVMKMGSESFAELSTLYYGRISLQLEKYDKAIEAFETLQSIAKLGNNRFEAMIGVMRAYYRNRNYQSATISAKKVLATEKGLSEYSDEANFVLAKSYISLGQRDEAIPVLKKLAKNKMTSEGAESTYLLILDSYDEGKFESVENLVYAFSDSKTPQTYWLAKSFIVLGDSFADREEWAQAKATFESIIDGYVPSNEHDDIVEQVKMRLNKIKNENI